MNRFQMKRMPSDKPDLRMAGRAVALGLMPIKVLNMSKSPLMKCFLLIGSLLHAAPALAEIERQPGVSPLVGTWHLVSYELRNGKGEVIHPMGRTAEGQIIYDAAGNMSCHLVNPKPPARPTDIADGAAYEARISYDRYSSYYGSYEIDLTTREVRHHVVGASMPNWAGTTVVRSYVFEGENELTLSASTGAGDQQAVLKWRRVR